MFRRIILSTLFITSFYSINTFSFYQGGQISIQNLILKKDSYSLDNFDLQMNETQTIIDFNDAHSANQSVKTFHLDCKQDKPISDLDIISIIQRCTDSGKITAQEVIITPTEQTNMEFSQTTPIGFLFSEVVSRSMNDFTDSDSTILEDIVLNIAKNKFDLELIMSNVKPKIKGEIYIYEKNIKIKIVSAKVSLISIKAKILEEIKKLEGKYPVKVTDDVVEITLKD